eukprot:156239_1
MAYLLILILTTSTLGSDCPCRVSRLCHNIQTNYSKELYGFVGGKYSQLNDTTQYNWTYITALAVQAGATKTSGMDEVMCTSHHHGVRMIYWGTPGLPFTDNTTRIWEWVVTLFETVTSLHYDGVTFDFEGAMLWTSHQSVQYVNIVNMTTQFFHDMLPGSTVSVCVPFIAYLAWGRQYDYYNLALASDYLYIMDYDANTQIWDSQCIARANAPYQITQRGVQSYLNLGIDPSKLILGVPWYGKQYPCVMEEMDQYPTGRICPIVPVATRGVNCSDFAGKEVPYALIMHNIWTEKWNVTEIRWDETMKSPYCNVYANGWDMDQVLQYWYDDPESLRYKYEYAKSMQLRGVGPFQFGDLIYDYSTEERNRAQEMWTSYDAFFV